MKAVIISIDFHTEDVLTTWIDDEPDPVLAAEHTLLAIGDDFSTYTHRIFADDEAQAIAVKRKVEAICGPEEGDIITEGGR